MTTILGWSAIRLLHALYALDGQHDVRADASERFSLPVYYLACDVPGRNPLGMRLADAFHRMHKAEPLPFDVSIA